MGATWSNKYGNARVNKAEPLGLQCEFVHDKLPEENTEYVINILAVESFFQ